MGRFLAERAEHKARFVGSGWLKEIAEQDDRTKRLNEAEFSRYTLCCGHSVAMPD